MACLLMLVCIILLSLVPFNGMLVCHMNLKCIFDVIRVLL